MQPIQQQVIEILLALPLEQQKVLDFAEFLSSKQERATNQPLDGQSEQLGTSFLEVARDYIVVPEKF